MTHHDGSIEVWYGWVIIGTSLLINTIALAPLNILFVTLKPIAADFDWPRVVPSLAVSLLMVGSGVGGLAMGWWMDKRGVMSPVLFGSVMMGLGAALASQAEGRWSLYLANGLFLGLLGQAAMIAPLVANATRWFDRRRGLAVAIIASGQGIAGAIWPPIVRYLSDAVGWRQTYLYFGIFALLTMVPLSLLLKPKPPIGGLDQVQDASHQQRRVLELSPHLVQGLLCLAVVGCCTAMSMPIVHLISHATDLGYPATQAAKFLSLLFAAAFASRIAFGLLADRIGGVRTLVIGSGLQAVMLLTFAVVESEAGLYAAALLFGLGFAGIMPCYSLIIRLWFPATESGRRIAMVYLFAALGMGLGGWLGGAVFDLTGSYFYAFLIGFGFNVMNFVVIGFLYLRQTRLGLSPLPA